MRFPLFIAEGAGANQGALILVGLLLPFITLFLGVRARFKKKRSVVAIVAAGLALIPSVFVLHIFGLPWAWDYWGAYIPLLPLVLSLVGLALSIQKKADPVGTDNSGAAPRRV